MRWCNFISSSSISYGLLSVATSAFRIALFAVALALALAEKLCDVRDERDECDERDERDVTVLKLAFEMLSSGYISQDLSNLEASTQLAKYPRFLVATRLY